MGEPRQIQQYVPLTGRNASADELCWSIGTLMEGSGIVEILSEAFGGVSKMLIGKK